MAIPYSGKTFELRAGDSVVLDRVVWVPRGALSRDETYSTPAVDAVRRRRGQEHPTDEEWGLLADVVPEAWIPVKEKTRMAFRSDPEVLAAVRLLKSKGFTPEMYAQELARREAMAPAPAKPRTCNQHEDCDAAEARAKEEGKPERFGPGTSRIEHCRDDDCDDCVPK